MLLFDKLNNQKEHKKPINKQDSLVSECYNYLETRKIKINKKAASLDEGLLNYGLDPDLYSKVLQEVEKNITQGLEKNDRRIEKVICDLIYFAY
ncbi:MAG: hypothetical protein C0432_04275 [Candidatus Puniceispirillum sp.]|nr:hypothetical protein [Candidatus Pelagibacter sp.]MBA4283492.1 hypothetical protein [Candidatus Puniceispirillum sp.]